MVKNKGSLWEKLDLLGLNEPKSETLGESAERRDKKYRIARDSDAPDARDREESAVAGLVTSNLKRSLAGKRGADLANERFDVRKNWAKGFAKKEWKRGSDLRPGEMASLIRSHFRDGMAGREIQLEELLPQSTVKGWIKSLAPKHLQGKRGRHTKY